MSSVLPKISRNEWLVIAAIFFIGLALRLFPGPDHFLWIYDQARDAYQSRSVIAERNVVIVGPQTDYPGLNHGPISYYFFAPFFFLSQGDPNLPGLAIILFNLSALIPLGLLTQALFKDKRITALSMLLFAISYEAIEYGRWIFNFSLSIPLLAWSFYFLWQALQRKWPVWLAGLALGLAIQGELYLLYLIPFFLGWLYAKKLPLKKYLSLVIGLGLGLSPLIIAELKFKFLGVRTFVGEFLLGHQEAIPASKAFLLYLEHMGATVKHTLFGLSYPMGLWALVALIGYFIWLWPKTSISIREKLTFVLVWLFSHSILFTFHVPDKVFLDLPVMLPLIILSAFVLVNLWEVGQRLVSGSIFVLILIFSLLNLINNTRSNTAFDSFRFIQQGMFFSQKMEIVDTMYQLTDGGPFTLTVLGTPYGVQTVWASVFEQHQRRNSHAVLPEWYGDRALGYHADEYFPKVDAPREKHIFLIESNQTLLPPALRQQVLDKMHLETDLVTEIKLHDYSIQLRQPLKQEVLE